MLNTNNSTDLHILSESQENSLDKRSVNSFGLSTIKNIESNFYKFGLHKIPKHIITSLRDEAYFREYDKSLYKCVFGLFRKVNVQHISDTGLFISNNYVASS
ncbi:MAG TPA: hypothetical protein VH481_03120 [Nitrososphaeraceae archaeon]|jgi:hypothetical protein